MTILGNQDTKNALNPDDPYYGAKVENVIATVFNELYSGMTLEEVVTDYAETRKIYKQEHYGKAPQTVNQFLAKKLEMARNEEEKNKIRTLMVELSLETGSPSTKIEISR